MAVGMRLIASLRGLYISHKISLTLQNNTNVLIAQAIC